MAKTDYKKRAATEEDYINSPRYSNSLEKYLEKNSEPLDNKKIGKLLGISETEVERIFEESVDLLRDDMVE